MKHKYPINTWIRFYQSGKMVIGIIHYHKEKESWESEYSYFTDVGTVVEGSILEARAPQ